MNTTAPKIPKLVSHAQFVTWCVAVEDAIFAAGAHAALREAVNEPIKPIATENLQVTAADLQVNVAELAYYRSWKDKDEKARGILLQNVSNGLRMKLQDCTSAKGAWEKLAKLHQVDDEDYRADIRNQLSTIVMTQADDAETFVERFETLLMTAKVAKLELSEAAKCSDFLRACRILTTTSEPSGVFKQSSPKQTTRNHSVHCRNYSTFMGYRYNGRKKSLALS